MIQKQRHVVEEEDNGDDEQVDEINDDQEEDEEFEIPEYTDTGKQSQAIRKLVRNLMNKVQGNLKPIHLLLANFFTNNKIK